MKNILRISFLALLFMVSACRNTELDDLLINPNEVTPESADIEFVLANVQLQFENFVHDAQNETAPYTRMLAMTGGQQYSNQDFPQNFDFTWEVAYARILTDVALVKQLAADKGLPIHGGVARVMEAYTWMTLVDLFGSVPRSEALQGTDIPSPAADDDDADYAHALGLLDEAIAELGKTAATPRTDLFYGGNKAKWIRLAKTLKLRYYLNTRLVDSGKAKAEINALLTEGDIISSAADDFRFPYSSNRLNPDARHPYYSDNYEVDAVTYLSNYYMWTFFGEKSVVDPRLRFYFYRQDGDTTDEDLFTLDCPTLPRPDHYTGPYPFCVAATNGYWGRDHGNADGIPPDGLKRTTFGVYPAGGSFDNDSFTGQGNGGQNGAKGAGILPIVMHPFVEFMKAEAALTLGAGTGDARAYLESAVRASIASVISISKAAVSVPAAFDPSAAAIDAYVGAVMDLYDAAGTDDARLDVIMKEYYLALWGNGLESYNNYRRTGKPTGMQPTLEPDPGQFPRLMWYPSAYVNRNQNASQRALTQQVFWDKNPAGFIN
jgi:hypothetical protein